MLDGDVDLDSIRRRAGRRRGRIVPWRTGDEAATLSEAAALEFWPRLPRYAGDQLEPDPSSSQLGASSAAVGERTHLRVAEAPPRDSAVTAASTRP